MRRSLDHRFQTVQRHVDQGVAPNGVLEKELWSLLTSGQACTEVVRARDIYAHPYKREVIEAFLLVDVSPEEIYTLLKVPINVTKTYAHLFFDTSAFEDELDRLDYAHTYDRDLYGKSLKEFAVDLGPESLKIRMARGTYYVKNIDVHSGIRSTAYLMGQMAKVNPLDSQVAKESLRWAQLGLKAATTEEESEKDQEARGINQILVALQAKDETLSPETSGISPEEILH